MNSNAKALHPYIKELHSKVINKDFLIDKSGVKVVEILAPRIILDSNELYIDFESRKSPRKYIQKELDWYLSHSLNIEKVNDVKIWQDVSDSNNEINSNYGNLVFSRNNFSQFSNVINTLMNHKDSRQAIILYNRPSIHYEWNAHDAKDFICTIDQHLFIRDNKLYCVTDMRSNDIIYGTFNDIPWFHFVIKVALDKLKDKYPELKLGDHIFIPHSLHCYESQFEVLEKLAKEIEV